MTDTLYIDYGIKDGYRITQSTKTGTMYFEPIHTEEQTEKE